jgi:hypothetical protein
MGIEVLLMGFMLFTSQQNVWLTTGFTPTQHIGEAPLFETAKPVVSH